MYCCEHKQTRPKNEAMWGGVTQLLSVIKISRFLSTDKSGAGVACIGTRLICVWTGNEADMCGLGTRLIYDCVDWERG